MQELAKRREESQHYLLEREDLEDGIKIPYVISILPSSLAHKKNRWIMAPAPALVPLATAAAAQEKGGRTCGAINYTLRDHAYANNHEDDPSYWTRTMGGCC